MPETVLRTKLRLPFTRPELVTRPRLKEQIAQGLRGSLTLISAPAGFGKTTLAASGVAVSGMAAAWLSLDKDDNREGRFLNYLIAALHEANNKIGDEARRLMAASQPVLSEIILTTLINDLESLGEEVALVLDDYHVIRHQAVHEAVAFLLEYCPETFHLVIASRSDPPLPITRLRARGQLVEIRAANLGFRESEAAQFLNEVMDLGLDGAAVAALEERTEGWITGLQMAALSIRGREDVREFIQRFSGTNRYILDYLLEEVLAGQPPEIRHFLLYTSILERLTPPLCDAVISEGNEPIMEGEDRAIGPELLLGGRAAGTLDYLERANLFLLPLDDERIWYRYHHLFADMLRARLHGSRPEVVPLLHIRASQWLQQENLITEALHHLFAAGEIGQAADLIERVGPAHLAEGDPSVLQMAESLPPEMILARPKIGLYQAWLLIVRGRIGKALPLLNDMARQLSDTDPGSKQQWIKIVVSLALAFLAPPSSASKVDPLPDYSLLKKIPPEEPILRNAADYLYCMTLGRRGELDRAAKVAIKCIERERTPPGTLDIPTLAPFLTRIYLIQGHLREAASLCREFLDPIQDQDIRFIYTAGSMKIDLGEVLYEWNRLEEAEQHIREGLQANKPWRNIMTDSFGLIALTRVLQAKGEYAGAMQSIEKFENRVLEHSQPREFDEDLRTLRIRLQLASGDLINPSHWADQIHLNKDYDLHKERYRLTLARVRLAQGKHAEVEDILAGTAPPVAAGSQISRQLETDLLLAAAIARQRRLPEAFALVESCLALAEPEGYIRIFLDVGEPIRDLLAAYLRSAAPGHKLFAQKVLDAFSPSGSGSPGTQPGRLIDPLSERELEVLQIMAQGRTNKEIAQQLVVAPGTVKAHTASIYRKLDVANRTEAVNRARQLGILA